MTQAVADPFSAPAQGGSKYPVLEVRDEEGNIVKSDDNCLRGRLLMITPTKIETVADKFSKTPGATVDRVTADVVVLDGSPIGPPEGEREEVPAAFDAMYFSQRAIVSQLRKALKANVAGADPKRMVLGRLDKEPPKEKGRYPTWVLRDFTPEEAQVARNYLATKDPFA